MRVLVTAVILMSAVACTSTATNDTADRSGALSSQVPARSPSAAAADDLYALSTNQAAAPANVAMVGDSITVASTEELEHELTALGLEVVAIDAQVGRRMTVGERGGLVAGVQVVKSVVQAAAPELWVVALGTNDIGQYPDLAAVTDQVREVLAAIPDGVPVVWVDTWFRSRPEQTEMVNRAIAAEVATRPGSMVVDWWSAGQDDGVVGRDGVHLTAAGTERFAEVVAAGVRELLDRGQLPQRD